MRSQLLQDERPDTNPTDSRAGSHASSGEEQGDVNNISPPTPPPPRRPLHVVLEHRSSNELSSYLEYLRSKQQKTKNDNHHQDNDDAHNNSDEDYRLQQLPTKLNINADYDQWLPQTSTTTNNNCCSSSSRGLITTKQRQQIFEALSEISENLHHLQIDLLICSDLFLLSSIQQQQAAEAAEQQQEDQFIMIDANEEEEETSSSLSSLIAAAPSSGSEMISVMNYIRQKLQILPCSLVTCILERAPRLETLTLKELQLSSDDDEDDDNEVGQLVSCLQSHPTIRKIDLRWKLTPTTTTTTPTTTTPAATARKEETTNNDNNTSLNIAATTQNRVLNPLIEGMVLNNQMKQLRQLNLMIPYWCPALFWLSQSTCLETLQLSVEHIPEPASTTTSMLLRGWKTNTTLKHLEISSFHILQDSSALLELIGTNNHLQHITVIDHNVFRRKRRRSSPNSLESTKRSSSSGNSNTSSSSSSCFAHELANVLGRNTSLKHLHLISKRRRRRRPVCDEDHQQLLGDMMEHNFVMERLEISHGGLQLSAPAPLPLYNSTATAMGYRYNVDHGNYRVPSGRGNQPTTTTQHQQHPKNNSSNVFQSTAGSPFVVIEDKLDFFLRLNQDGHRRKLFLSPGAFTEDQGRHGNDDDDNHHLSTSWYEAVLHYQNDTAGLFSLIQTAPSTVVDILLSGQNQ